VPANSSRCDGPTSTWPRDWSTSAKLDVAKISIHGLRHTHCSLALQDTPPHIVAARTGHTVQVLMSVSAHVLKDSGREAATRFAARLFG
jgi:integrase